VLRGSPPSIHKEGYEDDRKDEEALIGSAWMLTSIDNAPPHEGRKLTVEFTKGKGSGWSDGNSYGGYRWVLLLNQ